MRRRKGKSTSRSGSDTEQIWLSFNDNERKLLANFLDNLSEELLESLTVHQEKCLDQFCDAAFYGSEVSEAVFETTIREEYFCPALKALWGVVDVVPDPDEICIDEVNIDRPKYYKDGNVLKPSAWHY